MMFLTETHMHTALSSPCGRVKPEESIPAYKAAGYSAVVITDHFKRCCREGYGMTDDRAWIDKFLSGYRAAKEASASCGGPAVLLAMEICFDENANDYLVYGPTEDDLYRGPEMYAMGIRSFSTLARERGWLVVQAHPFRPHMVRCCPAYIDGVEVNNGNPRHNSRNLLAHAWAAEHGLLMTSGSDYHQVEDLARGGLLTPQLIGSISELIAAIRGKAGLYTLP